MTPPRSGQVSPPRAAGERGTPGLDPGDGVPARTRVWREGTARWWRLTALLIGLAVVGGVLYSEYYHRWAISMREAREPQQSGERRDERPGGLVLVDFASPWEYCSTWRPVAGWDRGEGEATGQGPAPLGYGYPGLGTRTSFGLSSSLQFPRLQVRQWFDVENPERFRVLDLGVLYDAGVDVRLNGELLVQDRVPATGSYATSTHRGAAIRWWSDLPADALVPGRNLISATVHASDPQTRGVVFELCLTGIAGARLLGPPRCLELDETGCALAWQTDTPARCRLRLTLPSGRVLTLPAGAQPVTEHFARVDLGSLLGPGEELVDRFEYVVEDLARGTRWRGPYRVDLAPREREVPVVALYGDSRMGIRPHTELAQRIKGLRPTLVVHTGDLVTDANVPRAWDAEWLLPASPLLAAVPCLIVPGNHDMVDGAGDPRAAFDSRNLELAPVRVGSAVFVPFDTNGGLVAGDPRLDELRENLRAADDAAYLFVVQHHPPRSLGRYRYEPREDLLALEVPLLVEHRVTAILAGHDHNYERIDVGLPCVISGGGGAPLREVEPGGEGEVAVEAFHFCTLEPGAETLLLEAISLDGRVLDRHEFPPR